MNKGGVERVQTGVPGLDEKIEGGIPRGSVVLVTGVPGSGKSILGLQYLVHGAVNCGEKGLYISSEQPKHELIGQGWQFGWDMEVLEKGGKIKIVAVNTEEFFELSKINELKQLICNGGFKRVVLDSTSSIVSSTMSPGGLVDALRSGLGPGSIGEIYRSTLISLIDVIKQTGATSLLISQRVEGMPGDTMDSVSEFRADGLWVLDARILGRTECRTIQIKKMRKTRIEIYPYDFEFTDKGIALKE
ncbi:MAG: ATPase domain-containing protein [Candidatus Thermoplasmatota archaeon]